MFRAPHKAVLLALLLTPAAWPQATPSFTPQEDGRGQSLFDAAWHAERRMALMEAVGEGVLIVRGAMENNDYRPFRQTNSFWYLTGIETPGATLVMVPKTKEQFLLLPHVSAQEELWVGDLTDAEEAVERTGIEDCISLSKRAPELDELLDDLRVFRTFYTPQAPEETWMMSRDQLQKHASVRRNDPLDGRDGREADFVKQLKSHYKVKVKNLSPFLDALRAIKTPQEAEAMRRAAEITGRAHVEVMRRSKAGDYEWQLAAAMTSVMLQGGAPSPAYMAIVGSGPNACTLHYTANNRAIENGDVVLIDYGCEFGYYDIDITRSWPVAGKFSERQRQVYEAVLEAQEAAIAAARPGATLSGLQAIAVEVFEAHGFSRRDMPHGLCHWIGMTTHDVGSYWEEVEPGMCFTIEPGIYLPREGIGVRIEDVVMITENGCEVLSDGIPKTVEEIESLRSE